MRKLLCTVAIAAGLLSAGQAAADTAFTLNGADGFSNGSWSFGEIFTVGAEAITVNALGAYDHNGDGFVSDGGIEVGIFRESDDALLVSTFVQSGNTLFNNFRYAAISDLVLNANTAYRVVAVSRSDLYNIFEGQTVHPAITRSGYGYCSTTALTSCDAQSGGERVWMANFQFNGGGGGVVPEPSTWAMMIRASAPRARWSVRVAGRPPRPDHSTRRPSRDAPAERRGRLSFSTDLPGRAARIFGASAGSR